MTTLKIPAAIEEFKSLLLKAEPQAVISVDEPAIDDGMWWIDVRFNALFMPTMWMKDRGFGIYTDPEPGFGERPNELHRTADTACKRFLQIAMHREGERSAGLTLADLRQLTGLNQTEFAKRMGVEQSTVSRFENRSNVEVDTLRRAVEALGGQLVMSVRMPTFEAEFLSSGASAGTMESRVEVQADIKPDNELLRSGMIPGVVKFYNDQKGFGFIQPADGGKDIFVHATALERAGMPILHEGQKVYFDTKQDRLTGKPSIRNIRETGTDSQSTKKH